MGAMFFAVLAVSGQIERNYIREKALEGQAIAASTGNHGGRRPEEPFTAEEIDLRDRLQSQPYPNAEMQ